MSKCLSKALRLLKTLGALYANVDKHTGIHGIRKFRKFVARYLYVVQINTRSRSIVFIVTAKRLSFSHRVLCARDWKSQSAGLVRITSAPPPPGSRAVR